VLVDETSIENPPDQNLQIAKTEHGNGALPAEPDVAEPLRLQFVVGVAEKAAGQRPIELSLQGNHGEGLAHARSDELLGIGIENNLAKRLRVAVEDRSHDTVAGRRDRIAEDRIGFVGRTPQQTCQRSVGGLFPPLPEQMKDEKERRRARSRVRLTTEVVLDHPEELRKQLDALRRGRVQCLSWKIRSVGQLVKDRLGIHRCPLSKPISSQSSRPRSVIEFTISGIAPNGRLSTANTTEIGPRERLRQEQRANRPKIKSGLRRAGLASQLPPRHLDQQRAACLGRR
jgi:hypothetical protein